jgi:PAS domain S-box-containing protein
MDEIEKLKNEIKELKTNEKNLEHKLWRFTELVKFLPPTWDLDVKTNVFWWSNEFRRMLGYENEKDFPNVAESWSDRLHPEDKQSTLDAFAAHIADKTGETPYDVKYRLYKKNNSMFWVRATGSTLRDDDGNPINVLGTAVDITGEINELGFSTETTLSFKGVTINFELLSGDHQDKYHKMYTSIARQCKEIGKSDYEKQRIKMRFFEEFRARHL